MIVRIFRVVTEPGQRARFEDFFRNTAVPLMKGTDGILDITFCLPRPETPDEFAIVMLWRGLDALKAFPGENWQEPHIHPDETGIVRERHLHHYEPLTS